MDRSEPNNRPGTGSFRAAPGAEAGWFGIYYGWYTVAYTVFAIMLVVGSTNYSFALFVKPVSEDLGLSRASLNTGMILFHVGTALFSPLVGKMLDRYAARTVLLVSAALFGAGMATISQTSSVILMGLCIVLPVAIGSLGCGGLFGAVVVARWFQELRGRALAISAMGTSFGGLIVFPIIAVLIDRFGWRTALFVTGIGIWIVVSLLAFVLREAPVLAARGQDRQAKSETRLWTAREVLGMRQFWIIAIAISLMLGVDGAVLVTVTPYAQERGFSLFQVTALMTTTTASAIAGKVIIAWIADKSDLRILIAITAFLAVIQCGVLLITPSFTLLLLVNALAGMAIGGTYPLYSAIVAERFGIASYGWVRGLMTPINSVFASAALYFVGAMFDREGHYMTAFTVFLIAAAIATVLILFLKKADREESSGTPQVPVPAPAE